ncbi:MAG: chemotaxis protein CheD [Firmicutes bacterium]|nr:chemotaxis protein CheD [Bacillota bacterium]
MKLELVVGIGEYSVSNQKGAQIKTYALSSCVAVTMYSPLRRAAGMVHIALPAPPSNSQGITRPGYYAVTGIPLLVKKMSENFGCLKEELVVQIFGGANSNRKNDIFNIGRKNVEAVRQVLAELKLQIKHADVGGSVSRTVSLSVDTGQVQVAKYPLLF